MTKRKGSSPADGGHETIGGSGLRIHAELARRLIVRFLRDGTRRHGFHRGVIGLSGGLDSALTAFLAAEALGSRNVRGVALPYSESDPLSLTCAEEVARATGIAQETVPITPMAQPYLDTVPEEERVRRGNVLARQRMVVLYDLSARDHALVIGTSNKTEILLGYTTLYGDSACALLPIGDLYKTQVRELARHVGVPERILARPPSADLWEGQTDEGELGFTYEDVDRLLVRMVDHRVDADRLVEEGFAPDLIRCVRKLIRTSQFKRRLPPVAKLSNRTVGIDFRYPRDWDSWDGD
jgi:NAD+ synthase